jgi:protein-L-isoaspartate O-methyltransferase
MLDMLQLKPGHRAFELGAGSGWNAALMGRLVAPQGNVYSLELIPEVACIAKENVEALGLTNVHIIEGDAGEGYPDAAPYDRVIFTAGTFDLPRPFFEQVVEGGLMLAVIKNEGGGDTLFLLRKTGDHFESIDAMPCGFVPMKGKYQYKGLEPVELESLPEWQELSEQRVRTRPYWWGGQGNWNLAWRTVGIRFFLSISEPTFRTFKIKMNEHNTEYYFGLWDPENKSLVLARDDALISYGNSIAEERLLQHIDQWTRLGMPSAPSFHLKIYPIDVSLSVRDDEWLIRRNESQFHWSLKI